MFPHRCIESVKFPDGGVLWFNSEICDAFRVRIFFISLPACLISCFRSFAVILPISSAFERRKQLPVNVWLQNGNSKMS